jgi:hypothetical protein
LGPHQVNRYTIFSGNAIALASARSDGTANLVACSEAEPTA